MATATLPLSNAAATRPYFLHALSSLHVGTERGVGYIDLPIAREAVTHWPYVPGTGIKGVLRDKHENKDKQAKKNDGSLRAAFGSADDEKNAAYSGPNSGSLVFSDARLVCLPIRSLFGTFAWVASPFCLARLARDFAAAGIADCPTISTNLTCAHVPAPKDGVASILREGNKVFLEDVDLESRECESAGRWAELIGGYVFDQPVAGVDWKTEFRKRFIVVPDSFFDFFCETGTEVAARIRIDDDSKRVAGGALWYEESLPAETVLAGVVTCDRVYLPGANVPTQSALLNEYCDGEHLLQLGGKATVGRGKVRCCFGPIAYQN